MMTRLGSVRRDRLLDFVRHQSGVDQIVDANVMLNATRQ
jgi:hypothetical protein